MEFLSIPLMTVTLKQLKIPTHKDCVSSSCKFSITQRENWIDCWGSRALWQHSHLDHERMLILFGHHSDHLCSFPLGN